MSRLDDRSYVSRLDPLDMVGLTAGFGAQCRQALEIARQSALPTWSARPDHVVLTGLGGSAAGGDLVSAYFGEVGSVPFIVNRDYQMPSFVGPGTLVFACSYSGNTEETLAAYDVAKRLGANIIVVSSGGKLTEKAKGDGFPVITVPGGQPPRTAMGYMAIPVFVACEQLGLVPKIDFDQAFLDVEQVAMTCGLDSPFEANEAKRVAEFLHNRMVVLYGASPWVFALAQRWRGQLNENSKVMVMTHQFPELCHNEILGWEGSQNQGVQQWATVVLFGGTESERMKSRIEITLDQVGDATTLMAVHACGSQLLGRMLSLAHIGDWVSIYLAALCEKDPGQMLAIDNLKEQLSKL